MNGKKYHRAGFAIVELVLAVFITLAVIGFFYGFMHGSLKVFHDVKSISDNVETKTPSIELMTRYFDRWGVGVPYSPSSMTTASCATYPVSNRKCVNIIQGSSCDIVEFYGNISGFGFVRSVNLGSAAIASCRLTTAGTGENCYYLWDGNQFDIANDLTSSNFIVPLRISSLSTEDADCTAITQSTKTNATMSATLSPISQYGSYPEKTVNPGDVVQRVPHMVRFYCENDENGRRWLAVRLLDMCTNQWEPQGQRIAPVESFHAVGEPSSTECNSLSGGICKTVRVTVTFRSEARKYTRKDSTDIHDAFTIERVMGR